MNSKNNLPEKKSAFKYLESSIYSVPWNEFKQFDRLQKSESSCRLFDASDAYSDLQRQYRLGYWGPLQPVHPVNDAEKPVQAQVLRFPSVSCLHPHVHLHAWRLSPELAVHGLYHRFCLFKRAVVRDHFAREDSVFGGSYLW